MSVSAIAPSVGQAPQSNFKDFRQDLRQLGKDLRAGDLSAAQADYVTLQQDLGQVSGNGTGASTTDSVSSALNQLGQDLQAGDLSAAQQDYTALRQTIQGHHGHHHHHRGDSGNSAISNFFNSVQQAFSQLGQSLQKGDLAGAQQAFAGIQQAFSQFVSGSGANSSSRPAGSSPSSDNGATPVPVQAPSTPSTPSAGSSFQYTVAITYAFVAQIQVVSTSASA